MPNILIDSMLISFSKIHCEKNNNLDNNQIGIPFYNLKLVYKNEDIKFKKILTIVYQFPSKLFRSIPVVCSSHKHHMSNVFIAYCKTHWFFTFLSFLYHFWDFSTFIAQHFDGYKSMAPTLWKKIKMFNRLKHMDDAVLFMKFFTFVLFYLFISIFFYF